MVVYQSNMVEAGAVNTPRLKGGASARQNLVRKGYRATHCKNGQEQRYEEEQNESSTEPDIVDIFVRCLSGTTTPEDYAYIESLRSAARERGLGKREGK